MSSAHKTRQTCGDTSLSYGLDGHAVGHPPCIAGPSRLFPSPHRLSHNRTVAPWLDTSNAATVANK